jgi:hypothetical protein
MFAGSCPGVSLPGAWYAEPIVTIPEYGSHLGVNVQFQFGSDGSYRYQARQGGLEWTRHNGRYRLAAVDAAGKAQGYVCEVTLVPDSGSIVVSRDVPYALRALGTKQLPTTEAISYRMMPLNGKFAMQPTTASPRSTEGWTLRPSR